jgi:hypothetical protein
MNREEMIAVMEQTAAEKPTAITIKGWGVVHVRAITVEEVEEQADDVADKNDKTRIARAAARLLCDEDGKRIFNPENKEDIALLSKQPWNKLRLLISTGDEQVKAAAEGN